MGIEKLNQVKLTIGIPTYNGEQFLEEKITSILNQDFTDFELIISDNASTDSTKEICSKFATNDKRVRFFSHEKNLGPRWNFNFILKKAKGEYFMWTAVDDKILPGFYGKNIEILERATVDHAHQISLGMNIFPNLLGEIAIYRFCSNFNWISYNSRNWSYNIKTRRLYFRSYHPHFLFITSTYFNYCLFFN